MADNDTLRDLHNKGQTDASRGVYEPPHDLITEISDLLRPNEVSERHREECEAHSTGHQHTWDQQHRGCFLTTACVSFAGLSDDCHELRTLRSFRDGYVAALPNGRALIAEYYEVAPKIVKAIEASPARTQELSRILVTVRRAVNLIDAKRHEQALDVYASMVGTLREQFLDAAPSWSGLSES